MQRLSLLLATFCFWPVPLLCAQGTDIPAGPVSGVWTEGGSPYRILGDVTAGYLVIEPGVTVESQGPYTFAIGGTLLAIGNSSQPITFTAVGNWRGLFFDNTQPGSELAHCVVEKATNSGVRLLNSAPTIRDCIVRDNHGGSGFRIDVTIDIGVDILIEGCEILSNDSSGHGGGVNAILDFRKLTLTGCRIIGNRANPAQSNGNYVGGGVRASGHVELYDCEILDNECYSRCSGHLCDAVGRGGGIYVSGTSTLQSCVVSGNYLWSRGHAGVSACTDAWSRGSGVYVNAGTHLLRNCVVSCNDSASTEYCAGNNPPGIMEGSGIYVLGGDVVIENCTVARNDNHGLRRGGGTVTALNSIFYHNTSTNQISPASPSSNLSVFYSCVENGFAGATNISANPAFAGTDCDCSDFLIQVGSPCINSGDPFVQDVCWPPSMGDGPFGTVDPHLPDMGAFGGPGACSWFQFDDFIRGECDGDGSTNLVDAIFLLQYLHIPGSAAPTCDDACDTNDDGALNITDAVYQLNYLFVPGSPMPPAPLTTCGSDPTADTLCCIDGPC